MTTQPYMLALQFMIVGKKVTNWSKWGTKHTHGIMLDLDNGGQLYMFCNKEAYAHMNSFAEPECFITKVRMLGYPMHEDGDTGNIQIEFSNGKHIYFIVYGASYIGIRYDDVTVIKSM